MPSIRYSTFPRTQSPPRFVEKIVGLFRASEHEIGTATRDKGLTSDEVLAVLRPSLVESGFHVEAGKRAEQKIRRPVFFGENATPSLQNETERRNRQARRSRL